MMSSVFVFLLTVSFLATPSSSATTSFVFGGCSQPKYLPGSPYESKVNSVLTSLVNSAMFSTYNNFTFPGSSSAGSQDILYGLFQCRGDLSSNDCSQCVARAVSQLGTLCVNSCGGALQLEGCFVKYDNATFLGVEDKTLVVKKCGPSNGFDSDALTDLDAVLANLGTGDGTYKPYRVSGSRNVRGVAQCVGDLSPSECQDCLSGAVGQLRSGCGTSSWGDIFLAKCYARYSGKFPSLLFPIEVKNIHKAKHGSDSGVYDTEGRFVPLKLEEIFAKHAHTHPHSLTSDELMGMLKANRVPKDYAGWVASYTEWKILYVLCKDKNGLLHKDTVRAVYDGTLFERMEKEKSGGDKKKDVV